jgi:membrane protein DedA with SNARE-associated domain
VITFSIVTTTIALAIGLICGYVIGRIHSDIEWKQVIKRTAKSSAREYFGY